MDELRQKTWYSVCGSCFSNTEAQAVLQHVGGMISGFQARNPADPLSDPIREGGCKFEVETSECGPA